MGEISRRNFIKLFGVSAAVLATGTGHAFSAFLEADSFDLLVVGDSLIWGQGLDEKDKFYSLVTTWLGNDGLAGKQTVNLKVKAHSGSTLKLHADEAEKYKRAGCDDGLSSGSRRIRVHRRQSAADLCVDCKLRHRRHRRPDGGQSHRSPKGWPRDLCLPRHGN